jgi:DNA-binding GntR family transcriptional regulator
MEYHGHPSSGMNAPREELLPLKRRFEGNGLRGEVIYRTLREAIICGILAEGRRVQDRPLAAALGVSRTPVREAMQRLQAEGFLTTLPRVGTVVASITPQDVEDIYVIRIALEGVAARLAAQRASQGDLDILRQIHRRIAEATAHHDGERLGDLNRAFHEAIYRAARNARLAELLGRLQNSIRRFKHSTLSDPARARQALDEHGELLEAIAGRDAERAEAVARRHKEQAMRARLRMYGVDGRDGVVGS